MLKTPAKLVDIRKLDYLVANDLITKAELEAAIADASKGPQDLESVLIDKYRIRKSDLGVSLSEFYQCPFIEYSERTLVDRELLKDLSLDYLRKNYWVPLHCDKHSIDIVIDDPHDIDKGLDIKRAFPGLTIRFAIGLRRDIEQFLLAATDHAGGLSMSEILGELASEAKQEEEDSSVGHVNENDSAIVRLANQIIADGYRLGASDILLEPQSDRKETVVRFRVDGTCFPYMKIPASYRRAIVSRLKIMASLDIAERRKPQDGKIKFKLAGNRQIELRVATVPTAGGNEDVVLRILTSKAPMPLHAMDFSKRTLSELQRIAEMPHGIILCVGPTGSGKTTTLHALLGYINTQERKIWTAEDPIEITQEGLRQVQVQPQIGFTFAAAMRAFLRADPDVIMIGEMRDKEAADIALEASLTGHLVLSTLHTNSAVETVIRLLDLGCDSFHFADAMLGVLAKRLCKLICKECKEGYHPSKKEYDELVAGYGADYWERLGIEYEEALTLYRGRGCEACNHTGYKGRIALHELLVGTEEMKELIQSKARTKALLNLALQQGMTTLLQDGIEKVLQGHTTYKQVRTTAIR
jgi:type II secretory ATPase GspE/PulE/Tfp pilus assembly ATPase PilB-like protein